MTTDDLRTRTSLLFESERARCISMAIEAINRGDTAEARRQGEWGRYYRECLDLLDEGVDPQIVARKALQVHQARTAAARAGQYMAAPRGDD